MKFIPLIFLCAGCTINIAKGGSLLAIHNKLECTQETNCTQTDVAKSAISVDANLGWNK